MIFPVQQISLIQNGKQTCYLLRRKPYDALETLGVASADRRLKTYYKVKIGAVVPVKDAKYMKTHGAIEIISVRAYYDILSLSPHDYAQCGYTSRVELIRTWMKAHDPVGYVKALENRLGWDYNAGFRREKHEELYNAWRVCFEYTKPTTLDNVAMDNTGSFAQQVGAADLDRIRSMTEGAKRIVSEYANALRQDDESM